MLKLQPNPTFRAKVGIPLPGGEKAEVVFTFKHMTRDALERWLTGEDAAKRSDVESVMDVVSGWDGIDADFSRDSVDALLQQYHAAARSIIGAYVSELSAARLGN